MKEPSPYPNAHMLSLRNFKNFLRKRRIGRRHYREMLLKATAANNLPVYRYLFRMPEIPDDHKLFAAIWTHDRLRAFSLLDKPNHHPPTYIKVWSPEGDTARPPVDRTLLDLAFRCANNSRKLDIVKRLVQHPNVSIRCLSEFGMAQAYYFGMPLMNVVLNEERQFDKLHSNSEVESKQLWFATLRFAGWAMANGRLDLLEQLLAGSDEDTVQTCREMANYYLANTELLSEEECFNFKLAAEQAEDHWLRRQL